MRFTAQVAGMRGVPSVLARFGVPAEPLLAQVGLTLEVLESADGVVAAEVPDTLVGLCMQATGCAHFGLLAGAAGPGLYSAGATGLAALDAATVGDALADLAARSRYLDPMFAFYCDVHGRDAVLGCELQAPGIRHGDQLYDWVLALLRTSMRQLCAPAWTPELVYLPRRRPRDLQPFRAALGPHLKFDAMRAALIFPADQLAVRVVDAQPARRLETLRHARQGAVKREPPLFADVRRAIRASMEHGHCSRDLIARRLGLHERTFCRRLRAHGTTFHEMLDATRLSVARELLAHTRAPVNRIAVALGYRDSTVFGRAFRRWTRVTPSEFRAAAASKAAQRGRAVAAPAGAAAGSADVARKSAA
jgi:AraC-like DNA-binding protein